MKRVCVFCGSNEGAQPEYRRAARQLGQVLVEQGLGLVYGGSKVGLMGEVSKTVLEAGGDVVGVIPEALVQQELAYHRLADLRVVGSMHERKALMAELADGFVALPGGLGTMEELFEILTWAQLGMHAKPSGLLNVCQYYDKLLDFVGHAVDERFVKPEHGQMLLVDSDPATLLRKMDAYQVPQIGKLY
jgi:uncharacterized protein (TIGR00730 family)